jgi:aspartate aminotransferase-like enzyme
MTSGPTQVRENGRFRRSFETIKPILIKDFLIFTKNIFKNAVFLVTKSQILIFSGEGMLRLDSVVYQYLNLWNVFLSLKLGFEAKDCKIC